MCVSPKRLLLHGEFIDVPCMRCYECIRKRKKDWTIRLTQELFVSDCAFFSLLSYDEQHLPDPPIADKVTIQLFVKRLRTILADKTELLKVLQTAIYECNLRTRQLPREAYMRLHPALRYIEPPESIECGSIRLKYFIVSEYGEERNRLHYHAVFFLKGVSSHVMTFPFWKALVEHVWSQGFCSAFVLTNHWITYACKYIQKSYNFMLHSRLGKDSFLERYRRDWKPRYQYDIPMFPIKGKPLFPPKSWLKELMGDQDYGIAMKKWSSEHVDNRRFSDRLAENDRFILDNPDRFKFDNSVPYKPADYFAAGIVPDSEFEYTDVITIIPEQGKLFNGSEV